MKNCRIGSQIAASSPLHMPNKICRFCEELKRRNIIRVITVKEGTAYVILEVVDMSMNWGSMPEASPA